MNDKCFKCTFALVFYTVISCVGFFSCSSDDDNHEIIPTKSSKFSKNDKEQLLQQIITLNNNNYGIKSLKEAHELGISDEEYNICKVSIQQANNMLHDIIDSLEALGYNVSVADYTFSKTNLKTLEAMANSESSASSMPHGILDALSNAPVTTSFFAPSRQAGVKANCYAYAALLPTHTIITTYGNSNALVAWKFFNGELKVGIPMSNCNIGLQYQTSDSNGGRCVWTGVTSI